MTNTEKMMSIQEVATMTGISVSGVRNAIERGDLTGYNVGAKGRIYYRVKSSDLEVFLSNRKATPRV